MTNQDIVGRIYKLQMLLKGRNGPIAAALEKATIPLVEHEKDLSSATRNDILEIKGIGKASVDLILEVIKGVHVYDIAKSVPKYKRKEKWMLECMK